MTKCNYCLSSGQLHGKKKKETQKGANLPTQKAMSLDLTTFQDYLEILMYIWDASTITCWQIIFKNVKFFTVQYYAAQINVPMN